MPDGTNIIAATSEDVAGLKHDLAEISGTVREFAAKITADTAAGHVLSAETREAVDKALTEQGALRARMDEVEQKLVRRGNDDQNAQAPSTPGERFLANDRVKAVLGQAGWRGRVRVDMAAITTSSAGATRDVLVPRDRHAGLLEIPDRRLTIRDLLTPGRTSSNAIQYVQELGFSNAAAVVSEGALKPESDIDYKLVTANVATIAHFIVASKQILDDAPQLETSIDGRLRYGLAYAEEVQLLSGDGTGANLLGVIPQATAFSRTFTPDLPTRIDDIRLAILQTELALFPASGIVMHDTDWARIETQKDTLGRYLFASTTDGQGMATTRLWGRSVVATQAITVTKFLVGAFKLGAQIFDREDAGVEISTEDSDNFRRNLVTLRGEERLALAVYRPEAFVYGTFATAT